MIAIDELPKRRPPHPGELLADVLEDHELTQQQLADALGIARHRLNEIIHGKRSITPDTALRLARVLRTSALVWLRVGSHGRRRVTGTDRPTGN